MNRYWLIGLVLLPIAAAGCSRDAGEPKPAPPQLVATKAPAPAPEAEPQCTGATELEPGVPGSPGHLIPSAINPNGQSELANRMRLMLAELTELKDAVAAGKPAKIGPGHERIRCSWPTDPRDRDVAFDGMAVTYLNAVDRFNEGPAVGTFNGVVQACLDCHANTCGGPMVAIRPLRIAQPGDAAPTPGMFE